jgi:hypothetical protein
MNHQKTFQYLALAALMSSHICSLGQSKMNTYTASNGIEYSEGDTLHLGKPTNITRREFSFIHASPTFGASFEGDMMYLPAQYAGQMLIIKNQEI